MHKTPNLTEKVSKVDLWFVVRLPNLTVTCHLLVLFILAPLMPSLQ